MLPNQTDYCLAERPDVPPPLSCPLPNVQNTARSVRPCLPANLMLPILAQIFAQVTAKGLAAFPHRLEFGDVRNRSIW